MLQQVPDQCAEHERTMTHTPAGQLLKAEAVSCIRSQSAGHLDKETNTCSLVGGKNMLCRHSIILCSSRVSCAC